MLRVRTVLDPVLHEKARPVRDDEFGEELESYLGEMVNTMYQENGVGLAAPQVGDSRRILVMDPDPPNGPVYQMVNPHILTESDATATMVEGCLSVPGSSVKVTRPKSLTVSWQDGWGKTHSQEFTGFLATIVQHEIDHLNGVTLVSRMSRFKKSRYLKKLRKVT